MCERYASTYLNNTNQTGNTCPPICHSSPHTRFGPYKPPADHSVRHTNVSHLPSCAILKISKYICIMKNVWQKYLLRLLFINYSRTKELFTFFITLSWLTTNVWITVPSEFVLKNCLWKLFPSYNAFYLWKLSMLRY